MNIAVIKLKDILKYAIISFVIITIVCTCINICNKEEFEGAIEYKEKAIKNSSFLYCLKITLPMITKKEERKENIEEDKMAEKILNTQLAFMSNIKEYKEAEELNETEEVHEVEIENNIQTMDVQEDVKTEVINERNFNAKYTDTMDTVKLNNQTQYNVSEILSNASYNLKNKDKVIIYHTHTCESYTSSDKYNYKMTGNYRTTDLNYTVARVGDELEKYLKGYGKTVVHDKTYHDYPSYNGSYGSSLTTMEKVLEANNDSEIVIDLHRDAVGSSNTYGPTVKIGDDICAQVMFVIGTDGSGLYHPKWRENLQFAITVQEKANEMYPRTF